MNNNKRLLLEWAAQSRLEPARLTEALRVGDALPTANDWRVFLDKLLLWFGAWLAASGVMFFFAYNWDELDRFTRFALIEVGIVLGLLVICWTGLERLSGKAALMVVSVFVGVLLALVGQTYQTGADPYELFGVWFLMLLPWAAIARLDTLWLLCLCLLNVTVILYVQVFGELLWFVFAFEQLLWLLFAINTLALVTWEWMLAKGKGQRRSAYWVTRLLVTASGGLSTALVVLSLLGWSDVSLLATAAVWLLWLGCAYYWYRRVLLDVYVLTFGVLSAVVVVNVALGRLLFESTSPTGSSLLLMSLLVITSSAAGALWLRRLIQGASDS